MKHGAPIAVRTRIAERVSAGADAAGRLLAGNLASDSDVKALPFEAVACFALRRRESDWRYACCAYVQPSSASAFAFAPACFALSLDASPSV